MVLAYMVSIMRRVRKQISVIVDIKGAEVKVIVDNEEAAKAQFVFDEAQIIVTDVGTDDAYQKCGYGRLLFDALKIISNQKKMPLILCSLDDAIPFYEKIGLLHLNDPEVQKKVIFGNLKTKDDIESKVDEDDFIWIPQSLNRRKPIIYL
jgi:hypothetical protein